MNRLGAGVILAGGSSLLKGLVSETERIFERPVRIGMPRKIIGLPVTYQYPAYTSAIGMFLLRLRDIRHEAVPKSPFGDGIKKVKDKVRNKLSSIWDKW